MFQNVPEGSEDKRFYKILQGFRWFLKVPEGPEKF
jgi:hypothetical protein